MWMMVLFAVSLPSDVWTWAYFNTVIFAGIYFASNLGCLDGISNKMMDFDHLRVNYKVE